VQLAARHRAFDQGTGGALVGEKVAAGERVFPGLDLHVEATGGGQCQQDQNRRD
jgi:hypothetical protein